MTIYECNPNIVTGVVPSLCLSIVEKLRSLRDIALDTKHAACFSSTHLASYARRAGHDVECVILLCDIAV